MRRSLIWFVLFCFLSAPLMSAPVHSTAFNSPIDKPIPNEALLKKIASLKIKDLQKLAGRKFSLKEKIAFFVLKKKLGHKSGDGQGQGQTSLIFGIGALALLVLAFLVPAAGVPLLASLVSSILAIVVGSVAKKKDPSDRKAHAGKLLGWITLGLIALLLILATVIIASWSWY